MPNIPDPAIILPVSEKTILLYMLYIIKYDTGSLYDSDRMLQ